MDLLHQIKKSLRLARTVTLPDAPKAASYILLPMVIADQHRAVHDLLSSSKHDPNFPFGRVHRTLLHIAANCGSYECLCLLLRRGCSPHVTDLAGCVPLHLAAKNGHKKCMKKLLDSNSDPNVKNNEGLTTIHWLAVNGRHEMLNDLLTYKCNIDLEDSQGQTALHIASQNGHIMAVKVLVKHGANVDISNHRKQTALHFAASHGQCATARVLLHACASWSYDVTDSSPLHAAVQGGYGELCQVFIEIKPELFDELVKALVHKNCSSKESYQVLRHLCLNEKSMRRRLVLSLANHATMQGQRLTQNDCFDEESLRSFISYMKHFCYVLSLDGGFTATTDCDICRPLELFWAELGDVFASVTRPVPYHRHRALCAVIHCYHLYSCAVTSAEEKFLRFISCNQQLIEHCISVDPTVIFDFLCFIFDQEDLYTRYLEAIHNQPFESRVTWFYERLYENDGTADTSSKEQILYVNRERLFDSSCQLLSGRNSQALRRNINVRFQGEEGMGHGVVREWLDVLSREMLNPDYALFTQSPDGCTFQPNPHSAVNPDHLQYFRFAGQALGLSLYHKHLLDVYFTRSFYKHILGVPVNYQDVASIDPDYAQSLQWILDNDVSEIGQDLTFSVETDVFGALQEVELKPGGATITVTQENKAEYVQLVTELRMTRAILPQLQAFLSGFREFIPRGLVRLFTPVELELLLSGRSELNIDEWRRNTEYTGYADSDDVIKWFWQAVSEFGQEERVKLLQFVTGSSRVPHGGFAQLSATGGAQFTITKAPYSPNILPTSSTCVNLLKLPFYSSQTELKDRLLVAILCGRLGYTNA